ncbi:MAG: hypothetical protein V8R80_10265 [Eubacterium sp.]
MIKKVDEIGHAIVLSDGTVIPAEQIWNIEKNPESGAGMISRWVTGCRVLFHCKTYRGIV